MKDESRLACCGGNADGENSGSPVYFYWQGVTGAWISHKSFWASGSPLYLSWILHNVQVEEGNRM